MEGKGPQAVCANNELRGEREKSDIYSVLRVEAGASVPERPVRSHRGSKGVRVGGEKLILLYQFILTFDSSPSTTRTSQPAYKI